MARNFGVVPEPPEVHPIAVCAPRMRVVVAERAGRIVGTGAAIDFGATGWLGGITVLPEARGAGLGRALTEAALTALGERATVLLIATDLGRPVYERLGFEVEAWYRIFDAPREAGRVPGVRPLTAADRDAVLALDRHATGEDRSIAVDAGLAGGVGLDGPDGLRGAALRPPWRASPIVARDPAAGAALLDAVARPGGRVVVPEANAAAVDALVARGCAERPAQARMRLGAPVGWRPEAVWGVFNLFFG